MSENPARKNTINGDNAADDDDFQSKAFDARDLFDMPDRDLHK